MSQNTSPFMHEMDRHLFHEGTHAALYEKLGAHLIQRGAERGCYFSVWAPNAEQVSVIGDFNGWTPGQTPLRHESDSSLWEGFVPNLEAGARYRYHLRSKYKGYTVEKIDPFGFYHAQAPTNVSVVASLDYEWGDADYMSTRAPKNKLSAPISVYEVHLGSWRRVPEEGDRFLTYRELAPRLADYVESLGFTHVELLPLMEHPFYGSWGYETTGYFAATSRYGALQDLMFLIDTLHQRGIGVILDWVPGHFPHDEHALSFFDGTGLYEHQDPKQGLHPDWNTHIYNYGRNEVRGFLLSSACFWLDVFHADGLRVDGVTSMLRLDFGRKPGEWIPNKFGGPENIDAVVFLRKLNEIAHERFPDALMIAEESTSWPMVTRPTYLGGLGFDLKWDLGWMQDTLSYMKKDPIYRRFHHNTMTFRGMYSSTENFILPLSHDEVVYGKGSLFDKMHGDEWRRFANLRLLYAYMWSLPGKKLLFMGGEFAQRREWNHDSSLDWHLPQEHSPHQQIAHLIGELNRIYRGEASLHAEEFNPQSFRWIDPDNAEYSVFVYERLSRDGRPVLVVLNCTPLPRPNFRVGVSAGGFWEEILNTDAAVFGGSGYGNLGGREAVPFPWHWRSWSLNLALPPLGAVFLSPQRDSLVEVPEAPSVEATEEVE